MSPLLYDLGYIYLKACFGKEEFINSECIIPPLNPPPLLLKEAEITHLLSTIPEWQHKKKERAIVRTFKFSDFKEAMDFVHRVATLAEKAAHHPDMNIQWNQVTLSLSTHSRGGLTPADFDLAAQMDTLLDE